MAFREIVKSRDSIKCRKCFNRIVRKKLFQKIYLSIYINIYYPYSICVCDRPFSQPPHIIETHDWCH